ncbi:MAG TPA: NUDIX hydrolase [Xanthobacteraceae bacterium]|nr:NUDIX hydrolase [Xanthobacteraceae bacterium]
MSDDIETRVEPGTATDRAERLTRTVRDLSFPTIKPRDSATLILIDRSGPVAKVLLGRRHARHAFVPGKFVFPGGRVEITDRLMPTAAPLDPRDCARLMQKVKRPSSAKATAFALSAVRETYEETGLMLGTRRRGSFAAPAGPWQAFAQAGVLPDLSAVHFIARAITPPGRPRRFDNRFFAADSSAIAHRAEGFVGPNAELVEIVWLPITEARSLDVPGITAIVLEELKDRIAAGMNHDRPVPFYRMLHKRFVREVF